MQLGEVEKLTSVIVERACSETGSSMWCPGRPPSIASALPDDRQG